MASNYWHGDVMVCEDCYFAHHYGAHEDPDQPGVWYSGESDTPADCEPLALLEGLELADHTDSNTGEGIDQISSAWCEGCGSTLGGSRHRLAYRLPPVRRGDRVRYTSPDGHSEDGTVHADHGEGMLVVSFDDGTYCNVASERCLVIGHVDHVR